MWQFLVPLRRGRRGPPAAGLGRSLPAVAALLVAHTVLVQILFFTRW